MAIDFKYEVKQAIEQTNSKPVENGESLLL